MGQHDEGDEMVEIDIIQPEYDGHRPSPTTPRRQPVNFLSDSETDEEVQPNLPKKKRKKRLKPKEVEPNLPKKKLKKRLKPKARESEIPALPSWDDDKPQQSRASRLTTIAVEDLEALGVIGARPSEVWVSEDLVDLGVYETRTGATQADAALDNRRSQRLAAAPSDVEALVDLGIYETRTGPTEALALDNRSRRNERFAAAPADGEALRELGVYEDGAEPNRSNKALAAAPEDVKALVDLGVYETRDFAANEEPGWEIDIILDEAEMIEPQK